MQQDTQYYVRSKILGHKSLRSNAENWRINDSSQHGHTVRRNRTCSSDLSVTDSDWQRFRPAENSHKTILASNLRHTTDGQKGSTTTAPAASRLPLGIKNQLQSKRSSRSLGRESGLIDLRFPYETACSPPPHFPAKIRRLRQFELNHSVNNRDLWPTGNAIHDVDRPARGDRFHCR